MMKFWLKGRFNRHFPFRIGVRAMMVECRSWAELSWSLRWTRANRKQG